MFFTRRNLLICTLLLSVVFYMVPRYEAEAVDPVTLAIVAPIALQTAKIIAPYIFQAVGNMGTHLLKSCKPLLETLLLPCGLVEATLLAPWRWRAGFKHMWQGLLGPVKFCGYMLLFPLSPFGITVNPGG